MRKEFLKNKRGITLIALVVTIIVLLILAGVSISMLTGENGIIEQANTAKTEQAHATVKEALLLEASSYKAKLYSGRTTETFIEYLGDKVTEDGEGEYIVNVEKLVGKMDLGKGTTTDVYKLEEIIQTSKTNKIASINEIKVAATSSGKKVYQLKYYGKAIDDDIELGEIYFENIEQSGDTKTITVRYGSEAAMYYGSDWDLSIEITDLSLTWEEFYAEYEDELNEAGWSIGEKDYWTGEEGWGLKPCVYPTGFGIYKGTVYNPKAVISEEANENNEVLIYFIPAECVIGTSDILSKVEGTTIKVKDAKEGDTIVYYDIEEETIKEGIINKKYIHPKATNFVKYTFEDGSILEATDYHPIYTKEGWKSYTRRNGYEKPEIGNEVKTEDGWKTLVNIETYTGEEDCYDFSVITKDGKTVDNYFANGTLVQSSIK